MQQINLFNPALIRHKEWLTTKTMAWCLAGVVASMLALSGFMQHNLTPIQKRSMMLADEVETLQAQRDELTRQQEEPVSDKSLQEALHATERKLAHDEQLLQYAGLATVSQSTGHSATMRGLARQRVRGVWLTGLEVDGTGKMNISGRSLSPDFLPEYITGLGQDAAFSGRSFAMLSVTSKKEDQKVPQDNAGDKPAEPSLPAFVEFKLQAQDSSNQQQGHAS